MHLLTSLARRAIRTSKEHWQLFNALRNVSLSTSFSQKGLLSDQVIVVTGAGQGIGEATSRLLASQGALLVLSDLDAEKCQRVANSINLAIQEQSGSTDRLCAVAVPGDVTKLGFPDSLIKETIENFGRINHIVNNAGYCFDGMLHRMSDDQWDLIQSVHTTAPFRIVRAAAPYMRLKDGQPRSIVNVSSTSGLHGNVGQANYATAKSGILGLTKTIAKEWGSSFGVRANSVAFGLIDTRLTRTKSDVYNGKAKEGKIWVEGAGEVKLGIPLPPGGEKERDEERRKVIPLGRVGNVDEAAGAICFLVSPWARPNVRYSGALGLSLIFSSFVLLSAGTFYAFSLYGPQLEKRLGYTASQTAAVASSSNLGVYLTGPIWGLLVDRVNPRWLFFIAALFISTGYALASYSCQGSFGPSISYLLLCLFYFIIGVGSGGAYHTGLATNLRNWPPNFRGLAIGIPVAVFGLCGFICAAVGRAFFSYSLSIPKGSELMGAGGGDAGSLDVPAFLAFLGIQGFIVNFIAAFVLTDIRHLRPGVISIDPPYQPRPVLASSNDDMNVSTPPRRPPSNVMSSPVMVDEEEEVDESVPFIQSAGSFRRGWTFPNLGEEEAKEDEEEDLLCFTQVDSYLLVLIMFAVTGTGLMVFNNIGTVILSLFPPKTPTTDPSFQATQSLHVTILSVSGFAGRLATGALSDHLASSSTFFVRRAAWAPMPCIIMLLGSVMAMRVTAIEDLVAVSIVIGIAYGAVWTLVPVLVNEFFGSKRFGFH
ncbi:hypothetical protein HDU67_006063, partial [Dinochytrium kinnereticum]